MTGSPAWLRKNANILLLVLVLRAPVYAARAAAQTTGSSDRVECVQLMVKIAEPVLGALAEGRLKQKLPAPEWEGDRARFAPLEAFGRTLTGIAPWLELGPDETEEGKLRAHFIALSTQALCNATDPHSPDFLNFDEGGQPLVDTAFMAHGLLRAPSQLWGRLNAVQQSNVVSALKASRRIKPGESNWLLFSAMVEAALWKFTGNCKLQPLEYAVRRHMEWYKGDGTYGDGAEFHWDYYNSYVIQPMLLDVLLVCRQKGHPLGELYPKVLARAQRYAVVQERLISPEGTFPVIGRSSVYRFGAFQLLSQICLMRELPKEVSPAMARSGMMAVIRNMSQAPGTFDTNGWLCVGAVGHQPSIRESYISIGSLYLCTAGLLQLGLPPNDSYWTAPAEPWTQKRIWSGQDVPADHALREKP